MWVLVATFFLDPAAVSAGHHPGHLNPAGGGFMTSYYRHVRLWLVVGEWPFFFPFFPFSLFPFCPIHNVLA